jgi:Tfp pilus assembly protein PilZ
VDIAQTRDVSKLGLCFVSSQRFSPGDEIFITLPYAKSQTPVETKAKIIWMAEGTSGRFYGVEYQR